MKLLITPTSPYARKAHIIILEKRLACDVVVAQPWDDAPEVVANNPLRKIPILLTDDGGAIVDSRVIAEYLDAQSDVFRVLPDDFAARIDTRTREAIADGALDACLGVLMAGKVAPQMQDDAWKTWLMNKTAGALAHFEGLIGGRDANAPDLGDIALACLLGTVSFRFPSIAWRDEHTRLAAWYDTVMQRESLQKTIPQA